MFVKKAKIGEKITIENLSVFKAIFLGVVQGLTEFLPVSSSAHLVIFQHLFQMKEGAILLAFDVALHFGTLLAVLFVFRKDLSKMIQESFSWLSGRSRGVQNGYPSARLMIRVGVATLPAVVVGLGLKHKIEHLFAAPRVAALGLLVTAVVLWGTQRVKLRPKGEKEMTFLSSLFVGLAQAVAITPGISRSGSTIAMGLFCGFEQLFAARFSFLMSIPAILGGVVLEFKELAHLGASHIVPVALGTFASAVTGFLAIKWLLRIIGQGRLHLFSYYCLVVGLLALIFL